MKDLVQNLTLKFSEQTSILTQCSCTPSMCLFDPIVESNVQLASKALFKPNSKHTGKQIRRAQVTDERYAEVGSDCSKLYESNTDFSAKNLTKQNNLFNTEKFCQ